MFTNIMFYIAWAVIALFLLPIVFLFSQTVKQKILACLCVLVVTCGVTALLYTYREKVCERWNNGTCECGGTYELSAATKYHSSESFYYTCDKCGHTEEFSSLMR